MYLTIKARYVSGEHLTNLPSSMTYVSVFSSDIVRLVLLIVALNYLYILPGDI